MSEIKSIGNNNLDYYVNFLENFKSNDLNARAKMLLPTSESRNIAGDDKTRVPSFHTTGIKLSDLNSHDTE